MDEARLKEIEARAEAATPGPWQQMNNASNHKPADIFSLGISDYVLTIREPHDEQAWAQWRDGSNDFVIHARQDIPDLVAALRQAWERAEQAERAEAALEALLSIAEPMKISDGRIAFVFEASAYDVLRRSLLGEPAVPDTGEAEPKT